MKMLAQSLILLLTASIAICISNNIDSVSNTKSKNIFLAARQRLSQQQQLQRPETINYDGNYQATKLYSSNNNKNNIDYKQYLRQQQSQNAVSRLPDPPEIVDHKTKALTERESALKLQREELEDGSRVMHSDLDEIFDDFQKRKQAFDGAVRDACVGTEAHNPYKSVGPKQENNSKNSIHVIMQRRSPPDANSALLADAEELDMDLPYGIQNVRKRGARQNPDFTRSIIYQSLCPTKRTSIPLETAGFEYRPNQYIEVTCAHQHNLNTYELRKNRVCSEAGFSCIQLNRTIHLIRRSKISSGECWESEIRIVPSGCECMWPKHDHGDIMVYHRLQKRYGGYANEQANADYEEGEGFRQIRPQQVDFFNVNGLNRDENADGVGFEVFQYPN